MCIAVVSPAGVKCPTLETLKNCWDNNRDGAGFAYPVRGGVKIQKGYMTWDAFKSAFEDANRRYDFDKLPLLCHFRITSHGKTCPELTHPFPLHSDIGAMKKLEYVSEYAVIHNGMIDLVNVPRTGDVSDTLVFIKDYLTLLSKNDGWLHVPENMKLVYKLINSRMAIMDSDGFIAMTDGFEEWEGNYYSNTSYKESRYRYNSYNNPHYSSCYNYDWYDNYDYDDDGCYASGYQHYDFHATSARSTNDDVFDFTHFDSDLNDSERKLMELHVGWTISKGGIDIVIDKQEDTENYFVDRKRNLWKARREHIKEPDGSFSNVVVGYELEETEIHIFDMNAKEVPWTPAITVKNTMFDD